jgi:NAD(P)-dependent dehydrogenase (short-subunit alcohol dehydrogenase family)
MDTWFEVGHVAIVTGGSRGLGKAVARELLTRGVQTIIDGRDRETLDAVAKEFREVGAVIAIAGDVTDKEHVHELIAAARQLGRLDLLVNNASTLGEIPLPGIDRLSASTFLHLFDVNVFAPIHLMQHGIEVMHEHGGVGTIVNVTSDAAVEAYPGWGGYGSSKAALEHVSRVLAAELDGSAIRVLVVDPGDMDTQMHRDAVPDADPSELRDPAASASALIQAIAGMRARYERVRLAAPVPA